MCLFPNIFFALYLNKVYKNSNLQQQQQKYTEATCTTSRALNISRNNFQSKIDDFANFQSIIENFSKKEAISEYHIIELNAKATYMRDKGSE